ncbi:MAG: PAS domain S-box protein [Cyanobacteria bacterium SBLK]|nr:PAS domain S-box protein [Cyanobacteria bacterium SBLK]
MLNTTTAKRAIKLLLLGERSNDRNSVHRWFADTQHEIEPTRADSMATAKICMRKETFDVVALKLSSDDRQANLREMTRYFTSEPENGLQASPLARSLPPLILLSDRDDPELAVRAMEMGVQDFLVVSQIDRRHFLRALRHACFRHRASLSQESPPRESRQEFTMQILNAIADPVFVKNRQNHYIAVNDAYCQWQGKPREEIIGKSPTDFFTPEEVEFFARQDAAVWQSGISRTCERTCQDSVGKIHFLATKVSVFTDEWGEKRLVGIIRDVSEQYRDRDRAHHSESLLNNILNTIPDPIFVKDEEHRWIVLNDACCNLIGHSRSTAIGKSDYDFFPQDEADVFWEKDEWVFQTGQSNENEESVTDGDGIQRTISTKKSAFTSADGTKVLVGCIRDITEQKQQAALGWKRERYLAALVKIQQKLLGCQNPRTCYNEILRILGTISGASRVYLFENHYSDEQDLLMSQKAEWCAPDIRAEVDNPIYQNLPYKDFSPEFARILVRGEIISDWVANLASPMKEILSEQNILSILVLPLRVNDAFFGFIGFDNCVEARAWDAAEVSLLQSAAVSISLAQQQWQAEIARKESEERYRCIVETANEGIVLIDLQGRIDFANQRAATMLGYDMGEVMGRSSTDLFGREMQDALRRMQKQRQSLDSEQYDLKLTHRSGKSVWVMISASPLWDEGEFLGFLGMMTDITQRKKAEADRDRFFTLSADMLCITGFDGYFKRLNPAWCEILGHPRETLLNRPYLEFIHPEDRDKTIAEAEHLASGGTSNIHFQNRYRHVSGEYKWLEWRSTAYLEEGLIYAVARDITSEKAIEADLRESTQRLAEAQKVAHVGDWEIDLISGAITWSKEMFRIYGLDKIPREKKSPWEFNSASTIIGQEYWQYIHPDDRAADRQARQRAIVTGEPYEIEQRIQRPDGEMRHLLLRGKPVTNDTGQVVRLFGTALDISDRKQIEQQLHWQEALLRSMADASPLAFFVVDNRTDAILYFNQRFCEIWGLQHRVEGMRRGELKNNDIIPDCIPLIADLPAFIESCKPLQSEANRAVVEDEIEFTDGRTIRRFSAQIRNEGDRYFGRLYLFEDITPRKQAEAALEHRIAIESLVTGISTQFINFDAHEIDRGINDALAQIGKFAGVDRAYLFQFSHDGKTVSNTHEWCDTGISTQIDNVQNFPASAIPWFIGKIRQFEIIYVPIVADLPPEAATEREIFESQEIQSLLCIPMSDRGRIVGFVGFDAVRERKTWIPSSINILRLVGEIFTNALERKRVEEALQLTQFAVDRTTDAIFRINCEGQFLYVNEAACRSLGYSVEELLAMEVGDIDPDYPPERFAEHWQDTKQQSDLFESYHRHKDGRIFPVEIVKVYLDWYGEESAFCFVRDISDRKQAERVLKESEEKYRNLQEGSGDAIVLADIDGNLLEANRKAEELLGYAKNELARMHFTQIHPPEELPRAIAAFEEDARTKKPGYLANSLVLTKDGRQVPVDISCSFSKTGDRWLIQGVFRDITERQQAEAKIQYRLSLEQLIANISTQFINLEIEELDRGIHVALEQVGEFIGVDRCYLFYIDRDRQTMRNLYEWCTEGIHSHRATGEDVALSVYPWFIEKIQRFEVVNVPRVSELPPEANFEQECLELQSVRSMLNVPMHVRGELLGFLGIDAVRAEKQWNEDNIGLLRIIGEIFAHTLERQQAELQLRQKHEELEAIFATFPDLFFRMAADGTILDYRGELSELYAPPETFLGQRIQDVLPADVAQKIDRGIQEGQRLRSVVGIEYNLCVPAGECEYEARLVPFQADQNIVIVRNITDRKQTERALRESEERFRQLAENINTIFWMSDPLKSQMIYVSPAYETIWGQSCQALYERPASFLEAIHRDDRHRIVAAIPKQLQGDYDEEYRILRPDGEMRWIRDRAFPICNEAGEVYRVVGLAEDISDRKRAEEALKAIAEGTAAQIGSEFFHSLVRHLAQVLQVRYAFVTQCVNPEKTRVRTLAFWQGDDFGDNFEYDLVHTPCERVIHGEVCLYSRGIQALFPQDPDLVTLGAESYSAIPLSDSGGNILGHLAIIDTKPMNDTRTPELIVRIFAARAGAELERLQAEEALQTSTERLQLALEGSALGLWDWRIDTGKTYYSPQWKAMLGYEEWELENIYDTWERLVHPEDLADTLEILRAHLQGEIPVYQAEFRMATKQGEWKWIFVRAKIFEWDEEGYPLRMTGTHKDISDRKAIERMKDEFISVISHELRTPMTSVRGALGLLATGKLGELTDKGQNMLAIAINNTDRLSRLINDILDLQRIESGQFSLQCRHSNACELCEQALDMMRDLANKQGISLSLSCATTSEIWVDPDYFLQILSNLLSNALKFSHSGTVISVDAAEYEGNLRFCIRDRGRGIPPEHLDSIFERFNQVDASDSRQKGGTGLGLAICRSLVQLHGGRIWVESALGEGSAFYFTVPIGDRHSLHSP